MQPTTVPTTTAPAPLPATKPPRPPVDAGATAWPLDRPAAISVIPLAGWLGFATVLAGEVWRRNGSAPPVAV